MQNQFSQAIEPWARALQLSEQHQYFEPRQSREIANMLAQLRYQAGLTKQLPPQAWF
jgi:primosomal protein N''